MYHNYDKNYDAMHQKDFSIQDYVFYFISSVATTNKDKIYWYEAMKQLDEILKSLQ